MRRYLFLFIGILFITSASAQLRLEGLWAGTLTIGGIESTSGYQLEMYIERKTRSRLEGRSYVHVTESRIVEMRFTGRIYKDLSVYIDEVEFISQDDEYIPAFLRKYQLQWLRSVSGSTLNGYWQEIRQKGVLDEARKRGRIFLQKVSESKV